jgi:hypothetical protein
VWLKGGEINPHIEQALRKILDQKAHVATLNDEAESRDNTITRIYDDQQRLRENLKALKGSARRAGRDDSEPGDGGGAVIQVGQAFSLSGFRWACVTESNRLEACPTYLSRPGASFWPPRRELLHVELKYGRVRYAV